MERLLACRGFQWDQGNADKNWLRHRVTRAECEQVFFNRPLVIAEDTRHSAAEPRFYALGETDTSRTLFLVFAIRGELVRVISARAASRPERRVYGQVKEDEG